MNPLRSAKVASALCGTVVLAGCGVAWLAGFGSAGIENAVGAVPIENHRAPSLTVDPEPVDAPQTAAMGSAAVADFDVATSATPGTAADLAPAFHEPESIVEAALPDPSQVPPPESVPMQVATAGTPDPVLTDLKEDASSIQIPDECLVADDCIDRYLWALYQRTPKAGHHQGAGAEESDRQEEGQDGDCHQEASPGSSTRTSRGRIRRRRKKPACR